MTSVIGRRAGRVIVTDPDGRVLLFRYDDPPPVGVHWCTPGGGLNDGEDYLTGACRELAEETGWADLVVTGPVFEHVRPVTIRGQFMHQQERFYVAALPRHRELGDVAAMHVADEIAAYRWWTLAELDATTETVWPGNLTDLVRKGHGRV